jgi:DNA-directed RNA polymerase subunit K/omega
MSNTGDIELGKSLPIRLMEEVQGSYRKTTLLQKRVRELVRGQRPLFETRLHDPIEIALEELSRGLIELVPEEGSHKA